MSVTLTLAGSYVSSALSSTPPKRGFKNGSTHTVGVVYSDGKVRLSNVVEENISNITLDYASSTNRQQANIEIDIVGQPPDWAEFYHIVWGGNQTKADWIYFGTNGVVTASNISTIDLDTITEFNSEYSDFASTDGTNLYYGYGFTKGDRIVPIYDANATAGYWSDKHGTEEGVIKEFDTSVSPDMIVTGKQSYPLS